MPATMAGMIFITARRWYYLQPNARLAWDDGGMKGGDAMKYAIINKIKYTFKPKRESREFWRQYITY